MWSQRRDAASPQSSPHPRQRTAWTAAGSQVIQVGGGNHRDREDRSDEYRNREPDDEQAADAQRRLAGSGSGDSSGAGTVTGGEDAEGGDQSREGSGERARFHPPVSEVAESAREMFADPEGSFEKLDESIDRSVVDEHPTDIRRARTLHAVVQGWLIEQRDHNGEHVVAPVGKDADGLQDVGHWWERDGYWSEGVRPLWDKADEIVDRDAEVVGMKPLSQPEQTVEYDDEMNDIAESMIGFSQAFVAKHFADSEGKLTVHRRWEGQAAERARAAKEAGEAFEVDPRVLESNSLSRERLLANASDSEVIVSREISVEDVGLYLTAFVPTHADTEEITTLGHTTYMIPPDQITVVNNHGPEN